MLNRNTPIQGPLTLEQTEQYNDLIFTMAYGVLRIRLTTDVALDMMRRAHADIMEIARVIDYTTCPITGLEDCNSRWCELHYMNVPLRLTVPGPHNCNAWAVEVGLATSCSYGCKVIRCEQCGAMTESHRAVYGCSIGQ